MRSIFGPAGARASGPACLLGALLSAGATGVGAATLHLNPGDNFEQAVENLAPGDTLIVHAGTYQGSGRIGITVRGTVAQPVVIEAAAGEARPRIVRPAGASAQNTINIEGATHLTIRGLEITSNGGDGVNLSGAVSWVTLENLVIHDVDVGVNLRSSMHHITVRDSEIYDTGGPGYTGEGMYIGCNDATCVVSDSVFEGNYIHHTLTSDQGDGIEIKHGSHSNVVRDNVIHDTHYPCILVYGTAGNPRNTVERNVMWNCGDSGIQAAADAVIRNNIILAGNATGFNSQDHQGATPQNLSFVNNTVVGGDPCLRLSNWNGKTGLVFANNAIYCPGGSYVLSGLAGVQAAGNVFAPAPPTFPAGSYTAGRSAALDLQDAAGRDVYPTSDSPLRGAGSAALNPADDFNSTARAGTHDAGAYVYTAANNPGWPVGPGFKGIAPTPSVTLDATPNPVASGATTTLTWTSANAATCTASGGWAGAKALTGSQASPALTQATTFALECAAAGGAVASDAVTVGVTAPAPSVTLDAAPNPVASGATTTLSWSSANAATCTASGGWSGARALAGSQASTALTQTTTFSLACTAAGGAVASDAVTVTVTAPPQPPPDDPDPPVTESGGGGAIGLPALAMLALGLLGRRPPA